MTNRLAHASSPYLRQHAGNPVDWWEWGEEAFERARETDRPVLVSIGYSTCHWCHVMAHESFSDEEIARQINEHFVAIKVDREERPDVDAIYMEACQALTGHGGWPLNVFTTPEGKPFFAGTYWPPADRPGHPGLPRVLQAVHDGWTNDREKMLDASVKLTDHISHRTSTDTRGTTEWDDDLPAAVVDAAVRAADDQHGGFGRAPKFPQAMFIDFVLAHHLRTGSAQARDVALTALDGMARGGIHDHVGGGFARYSVDARWHVPHFEKMLYDNALLLRAYAHAAVVDGAPRHARVARHTARWLLDELRHPDGGFYSAWDADSPGGEGAYYTWTAEEFDAVVARTGEDPKRWREVFGVTDEGNWSDPHGHAPPRANVLWRPAAPGDGGPGEAAVLAALREHRSLRVPPHRDEKVLTSWNALAIAALAEAGALLDEPAFVDAARQACAFLDRHLVVDGVLHHTWSEGHGASVPALLEDLALLAQALLVLYESHPEPDLVDRAGALITQADTFADGEGGWYASGDTSLVVRPRETWDNATPAAQSALADASLRLFGLTGDAAHLDRGESIIRRGAAAIRRNPLGYGELLRAAERLLGGPREVAIVGPDAARLARAYHAGWHPDSVLAVAEAPTDRPPLLASRTPVDGGAAAYVCRAFTCDRPVTTPEELTAALSR